MTSTSAPVILILGAGPGLGMSVAHRFGKEGYAVALISRSTARHADYLRSARPTPALTPLRSPPMPLTQRNCASRSTSRVPASVASTSATTASRTIDARWSDDITTLGRRRCRSPRCVKSCPRSNSRSLLLPEFTDRGYGALLFAGRAQQRRCRCHRLVDLALTSAALRNYAVTLHAALQPVGIYCRHHHHRRPDRTQRHPHGSA